MFVVRCWGVSYEGGHEDWKIGYLDSTGRVGPLRQAHKFKTEADAWDFAVMSGTMGWDEERGEWCWVEPI